MADKKSAAAKEKEEYDKKSFGEKLGKKVLLNESKPSGNYFNQTFIPTLFPVEGVKGSINIPGYMKATGAKGTVNVRVFELSYTLDVTQTKITYYPLKMVLTITNDKGMLTYQGDLPNNSAVMTYTAATSSAMGNSYLSILKGIETGAKNAAITNLNSYLKTNYGFNTLKDERPFFDVKDKKQSYPEYHEAFEKVKNAFVYCNMPGKQDAMTAKLKEAISIWEKSIKELDKTNKDARINKDVGAATYLNLAEACTWVKDFDKAYEYLASYKLLDEDYSRAYKDISDFLKDYSTRYNKYSQY